MLNPTNLKANKRARDKEEKPSSKKKASDDFKDTNCVKVCLLNTKKSNLDLSDEVLADIISAFPPKAIFRDIPSWTLSFVAAKDAFCVTRDFDKKLSIEGSPLSVSVIKQTIIPLYSISDSDMMKIPIRNTPFAKQVILVSQNQDVDAAISSLLAGKNINSLNKDEIILGMDIEVRPAFKKGEYYTTSLVQLSSQEVTVLFHLTFLSEFPVLLREILESELIIKTGVGLNGDTQRLKNDFDVNCKNVVDIGTIPIVSRCKPQSLRGLAAIFLNVRIPKKLATTNWNQQLNNHQITYAANDAYMSREIFIKVKTLEYDPYTM